MSAARVLEEARSRGIVLSGCGSKLRYEAPAGRLTPELREALIVQKTAILDLLEAERTDARRLISCRDCAHYIASPPVHRASGAIWEMPGGCSGGRTFSDRRPPIYPFTGWYCDGWKPRRLQ